MSDQSTYAYTSTRSTRSTNTGPEIWRVEDAIRAIFALEPYERLDPYRGTCLSLVKAGNRRCSYFDAMQREPARRDERAQLVRSFLARREPEDPADFKASVLRFIEIAVCHKYYHVDWAMDAADAWFKTQERKNVARIAALPSVPQVLAPEGRGVEMKPYIRGRDEEQLRRLVDMPLEYTEKEQEDRDGQVYITVSPDLPGYIKIGYTCTTLERRFDGARRDCRIRFELAYTTDVVPHASRLEKIVHNELADKRYRFARPCTFCTYPVRHQEWFLTTVEYAAKVAEYWKARLFEGMYDPWSRLLVAIRREDILRSASPASIKERELRFSPKAEGIMPAGHLPSPQTPPGSPTPVTRNASRQLDEAQAIERTSAKKDQVVVKVIEAPITPPETPEANASTGNGSKPRIDSPQSVVSIGPTTPTKNAAPSSIPTTPKRTESRLRAVEASPSPMPASIHTDRTSNTDATAISASTSPPTLATRSSPASEIPGTKTRDPKPPVAEAPTTKAPATEGPAEKPTAAETSVFEAPATNKAEIKTTEIRTTEDKAAESKNTELHTVEVKAADARTLGSMPAKVNSKEAKATEAQTLPSKTETPETPPIEAVKAQNPASKAEEAETKEDETPDAVVSEKSKQQEDVLKSERVWKATFDLKELGKSLLPERGDKAEPPTSTTEDFQIGTPLFNLGSGKKFDLGFREKVDSESGQTFTFGSGEKFEPTPRAKLFDFGGSEKVEPTPGAKLFRFSGGEKSEPTSGTKLFDFGGKEELGLSPGAKLFDIGNEPKLDFGSTKTFSFESGEKSESSNGTKPFEFGSGQKFAFESGEKSGTASGAKVDFGSELRKESRLTTSQGKEGQTQ